MPAPVSMVPCQQCRAHGMISREPPKRAAVLLGWADVREANRVRADLRLGFCHGIDSSPRNGRPPR
ncbi:hypothetical protein ARTHRO9V_20073 [Arthrobacter sp. 9V]|nr:hypothetical protein ARTHRO9V_20073 [Arthrobacter sp. 9V]